MVPVRKFSTRTSDDLTSALTTSTASGALRSSVMPRLLRLKSRYAAASPSLCGVQVRDSSPAPVSSTLMTSAPRSARRAPHQGPAITRERSMTRMPSSASGKGVMPVLYRGSALARGGVGAGARFLGEAEQRQHEGHDDGAQHDPDRAEGFDSP